MGDYPVRSEEVNPCFSFNVSTGDPEVVDNEPASKGRWITLCVRSLFVSTRAKSGSARLIKDRILCGKR
jgi:hypothetical protein